MRTLVTGATGFIGRYLFLKLRKMGHDVVGVSLKGGKIDDEKTLSLNITNWNEVISLFNKKFDIVLHLAAFIPKNTFQHDVEKCLRVNGIGTYHILKASKETNIRKLVYASSASVYNRYDTFMPAKEEYAKPENIYGASKLLGENLCEIFRRDYHLSTVSLRYASVYGYGQEPYCVLPLFVEKAIKCEKIPVWGEGVRTQDFVYVEDVADATAKAGFSDIEGIFNIGSGEETSMLTLAKKISKVFTDNKAIIEKQEVENEDRTRFCLDISKAKREMDFTPKFSLESGLREYKRKMKMIL